MFPTACATGISRGGRVGARACLPGRHVTRRPAHPPLVACYDSASARPDARVFGARAGAESEACGRVWS